MSKFTERIEHDLSQIADRATPSSTAWESIQHRIAEQDTEPTMEVIMLNPDQKKPPAVSRTWMAAAAALVLIVGIAGLVALLNRDDGGDIDTIDEPDVTVPLELDDALEPEVIVPDSVPDDVEPDAEAEVVVPDDEAETSSETVVPDEPLQMSGFAVADCNFGSEDLNPDDLNSTISQSCKYRETNVVPFEPIQQYVMTVYEDPAFHDGSAVPYSPATGLSDSGFMWAGYMWQAQPGINTRFVGVAEGVGPYDGMLIYFSGRSFSEGGGQVFLQWATEDELSTLKINGTDVEAEEVAPDCEIVGFVEDGDLDPQTEQYRLQCTVDGIVIEQNTYLFGPEEGTVGIGSNRFIVSTGDSVTSGVIPRDGGPSLSIGISQGTGENEGLLLHQLTTGTVTAAGDSDSTTVQVALPPDE